MFNSLGDNIPIVYNLYFKVFYAIGYSWINTIIKKAVNSDTNSSSTTSRGSNSSVAACIGISNNISVTTIRVILKVASISLVSSSNFIR